MTRTEKAVSSIFIVLSGALALTAVAACMADEPETGGLGAMPEGMRTDKFQWDAWNIQKVQARVFIDECESVFRDEKAEVKKDVKHSQYEERFNIIGKSHKENYLYITFTIRHEEIRIISARKAKEKEKKKFGYAGG